MKHKDTQINAPMTEYQLQSHTHKQAHN